MSTRNWELEVKNRVKWIQDILAEANAKGIVIGASGGKDSAVVEALSKLATPNVLAVIMPIGNNVKDEEDAYKVSAAFDIETIVVDLKLAWSVLEVSIAKGLDKEIDKMALSNIKPRLRMTTLYSIGQTLGYLVAGTGNKSEITMGYFTKWGDGASDFNPIADLTVKEVFELAEYLGIPDDIINKPPSANLWEGQTDEEEMGITYKAIDTFLLEGTGTKEDIDKIKLALKRNEHKRNMPKTFK